MHADPDHTESNPASRFGEESGTSGRVSPMTPTWSDHRVPASEDCVLRFVLERWATETPGAVFAHFEDGGEWTYLQMLQETQRTAAGLHELGVKEGENVLSWFPNGRDALRVWFGINYLGAVYVPINTAYRGALLEHVIRNAGAALMVAEASLARRLPGCDLSGLRHLVVTSTLDESEIPGVTRHPMSALDGDPGKLPAAPPLKPWSTQSIIYTSGTTGRSKGVLSSYLHLYSMSTEPVHFLGQSDRWLLTGPLFHVGGTCGVSAMLWRGASIAVVESFRLDGFWNLVRITKSTFAVLLGSMVTLLVKQPPSSQDIGHGMKYVFMIPLAHDPAAFRDRFGADVYTVYNMSEMSSPLTAGPNPAVVGTCGKARSGFEVRLVDDNDCEVSAGSVGELLVRTDRPWALSHGYFQDAEATARTFRNGWFHTGDAFRQDESGNFFFVDRLKDSIRRRGENISSFEVEVEVCSHPCVEEAVAIPVPSEFGEDEVLVVLVPVPGSQVDPADLLRHLSTRLAHFMIPRYVRTVTALPKTPTEKVEKHVLRAQGITADTWDRERAGIVIKRDATTRMASATTHSAR